MVIPPIVHQTWKNSSPSEYDNYVKTWNSVGWLNRKFYSDIDIKNYIKNNFSHYYDFFLKMNKTIERVDFFRYALMYKDGGIYADMDTTIMDSGSLSKLMNNKIVFGYENTFGRRLISQCILLSEKNNVFWLDLMYFIKRNYSSSKYPPYNTGPDIVSSFIKIYGRQYSLSFCPYLDSGHIVKHHKTGVWRDSDTTKLNKTCLICKKISSLCNCYLDNWFLNK